ncbi:MAG: hypothetical protein Kow00105_04630 [Phycisphaeraceae bacterium]
MSGLFRQGVWWIGVLLVGLFYPASVTAGENPYPREWFWGDDDQRAVHDAMIGNPAPDMVLSDWINGRPTGKTLKNKILVIDFWATWCGPCIASIPHNNEMAEKYADQGVVVIGVCGSRHGQEEMERVARQNHIRYPVAKDHTYKAAEAWHVMWWPTYAVVDRNRIVRAVGLKPSYVDDVVEQLIAEQPFAQDQGEAEDSQAADSTDDSDHAEDGSTATGTSATIDPAWLEGSEQQRSRLSDLEGNVPPTLAVDHWLNSEPLTLNDLQGKVVLLDFWATWCGPCIASIPHTNELAEKYADQGLVVIGVCHTEGGENMPQTAEKYGIRYPIAVDVDEQTVKAYKVNGFPDYYLIDRAGNLRIADCANGAVDQAVQALLAEPAPDQAASAE